MKTFILVSNECKAENADDIKVNQIFGIYQNESKAFWECRELNLKKSKKTKVYYILKEIDLETNEILNSYTLNEENKIIDNEGKIYKIPVFYDKLKDDNKFTFS